MKEIKEELKQLKSKKFGYGLLLAIGGGIIPRVRKSINALLDELEDLIKTKKSEINLDKIQNKNKKARK